MAGAVSGAVILNGIRVGPHAYPALEEGKIPGDQFHLLSLAIGGASHRHARRRFPADGSDDFRKAGEIVELDLTGGAGTDSLPNLDGSR